MTYINGGKPFYGNSIGILMTDAVVPRLVGDIGNAATFDFPVRYKVVWGATVEKIIHSPDLKMLEPYIEAGKELEREGVLAITTSCGYLALFQREMAEALDVPVFASSLLQLPMVLRMLKKNQKIGILAADSRTLSIDHLRSCGITEDMPVVVKGAEEAPAFYNAFVCNGPKINFEAAVKDIVNIVLDLKDKHPEVGAIVCEGSNFALFRPYVQEATGLPFFDIVTLTRMIYRTVVPIHPAPTPIVNGNIL